MVVQAIGAFLFAALVSLVLTPVAIATAVRLGVLDRPGAHKSHTTPTPYLGGIAIVVAVALSITVAAALRAGSGSLVQLGGLLVTAVLVAIVGLVDDLRGLPVTVRFGAQLAAALSLWQLGIRAEVTQIVWLDLAITVVWVVGITNAMNLLDNMDALTASTATIASLWFGVIGLVNGQVLVAALAFAVAGGAAGFLRDNRPPARIYMGDAGSLFLGVMLAALGMLVESCRSTDRGRRDPGADPDRAGARHRPRRHRPGPARHQSVPGREGPHQPPSGAPRAERARGRRTHRGREPRPRLGRPHRAADRPRQRSAAAGPDRWIRRAALRAAREGAGLREQSWTGPRHHGARRGPRGA
jgi:UDP-N-acetylmuramyl pentapeptide phosphotransferase/UDP-N-acetylglucosamine-1-phosphate transferase